MTVRRPESRKPSEERFGERLHFFRWKFQVLLDAENACAVTKVTCNIANFQDRYRMAPVFEAKRRSIRGNSSGGRSAVAGYPSLVNFMEQKPPQLRHELRAGQMAMVAIGGSIGTGLLLGWGAAVQIAGLN